MNWPYLQFQKKKNDFSEYLTPDELAKALYIQNVSFPNERFELLTQMVNEISHEYHLPYSAQDTGQNRWIQIYSWCYDKITNGILMSVISEIIH